MARPERVPASAPSPAAPAAPPDAYQSATDAIEQRIDERRAAEGEVPGAVERARVDQAMRQAGSRFGPKVAAGAAPAGMRRTLSQERFEIASARWNTWAADAPTGVTLEDLLAPQFWVNIGPQLRQWDHICVRSDDGTFFAELIVEDRGPKHAKCAVLNYVELRVADPEGPSFPDGYEIKYKGAHGQWTVLDHGRVLREKFGTYGSAHAYLTDHLRTISR